VPTSQPRELNFGNQF